MNNWNPYMNDAHFYDEGYDVDDVMRDENYPTALPTVQMKTTAYAHVPSCGCHSTPMWHGAAPSIMEGAYGSPDAGATMLPSTVPMENMSMLLGAPMMGPTYPTTCTMMPMAYPYGPSYYGMPSYPYGYYPHR